MELDPSPPFDIEGTHSIRSTLSNRLSTVALVMRVAACGQAQSDPAATSAPTQMSLAGEPAAQLQVEGSTQLSSGGHDAESGIEGSSSALTVREYGVDATWDQIVAKFDTVLKGQGWRDGGCSSALKSTREWAVMAWHTDDRVLRLSHRRGPSIKGLGSFRVVYQVALIGEGLEPACPENRQP